MTQELSAIFHTGIGATPELSLRVSVATLVRVVFENPRDGETMLVLERKAALRPTENGETVVVKSQPFGGAIRIRDLAGLQALLGDFQFDSERSRSEQDFRICIRPAAWERVQEICAARFSDGDDPLLETGPQRELVEEFAGATNIDLQPAHYTLQPVATVVEQNPVPTTNIHATGMLTARIYRVFEARLVDTALIQNLMAHNESLSPQGVCELVWANVRNGGRGRANTILALPLQRITAHCLALPPAEHTAPIWFEDNRLEENILAILEGIPVPKYQRR